MLTPHDLLVGSIAQQLLNDKEAHDKMPRNGRGDTLKDKKGNETNASRVFDVIILRRNI